MSLCAVLSPLFICRDASLENLPAEKYHWRKQSAEEVSTYQHSMLEKKSPTRNESFSL